MLLTQLRYFEALARERHFGRAAASCFVTTSTLSEAIRKLEAELKVPLVNRGRSTYRGLTPEGELVLSYARRIVTDHRALVEDLSARRGQLETTVRLGVIPAGLSRGTAVLEALCRENPGVSVDLVAGLRSEEILAKLQSAELDAGIIHPALGSAQSVTGLHVTDLGFGGFRAARRRGSRAGGQDHDDRRGSGGYSRGGVVPGDAGARGVRPGDGRCGRAGGTGGRGGLGGSAARPGRHRAVGGGRARGRYRRNRGSRGNRGEQRE